MVSNDLVKQLHDRATRDEPLSAEEQAQLENWYVLQDDAESSMLSLTPADRTPTALQAQVDIALTQLTTVTKRIQEIASENEALRREIAALRHQVAHLSRLQPA
jgi:hypothetical protein